MGVVLTKYKVAKKILFSELNVEEYRQSRLKVKYCYGCMTLKGKDEFYSAKRKRKDNRFSNNHYIAFSRNGIKVDYVCRDCRSKIRKIKYLKVGKNANYSN